MISRATIEAALRTWLVTEMSGVEVVFAQQGAPRPSTPFATVKIAGVKAIGQDHRAGWGADPGAPAYVPRKLAGDRQLSCSVQVFGSGALDYARAAANGLEKGTIQDALHAAGLSPLAGPPEVRDLTELWDTDFEERGQFDAEFLTLDAYTDDTPVIETVTGTITVDAPDDPGRETITYDTATGP